MFEFEAIALRFRALDFEAVEEAQAGHDRITKSSKRLRFDMGNVFH